MRHFWFSLLVLFAACSTPPENPGEVYDLRNQAEAQLTLGGRQADRGDYETALVILSEARRLAVSVDDPSLRIRTALACGNALFSLGRVAEAGAAWQNARAEAEQAENRELTAVSRIHLARGTLLSPGGDSPETARSVREEAQQAQAVIKSDRRYIAFAWLVTGLAERALGRSAEAEAAVKHSLDIHEKDRYLEQAAYDWFLIASIRSLSGNYSGAAQALQSAIAFDRRVENAAGLAADWRALGDVQKKAGADAEARAAYHRAAEIFRSLGNDSTAVETEQRIDGGR
jgi:tetratricopeptide (TPR) repeat protein